MDAHPYAPSCDASDAMHARILSSTLRMRAFCALVSLKLRSYFPSLPPSSLSIHQTHHRPIHQFDHLHLARVVRLRRWQSIFQHYSIIRRLFRYAIPQHYHTYPLCECSPPQLRGLQFLSKRFRYRCAWNSTADPPPFHNVFGKRTRQWVQSRIACKVALAFLHCWPGSEWIFHQNRKLWIGKRFWTYNWFAALVEHIGQTNVLFLWRCSCMHFRKWTFWLIEDHRCHWINRFQTVPVLALTQACSTHFPHIHRLSVIRLSIFNSFNNARFE